MAKNLTEMVTDIKNQLKIVLLCDEKKAASAAVRAVAVDFLNGKTILKKTNDRKEERFKSFQGTAKGLVKTAFGTVKGT